MISGVDGVEVAADEELEWGFGADAHAEGAGGRVGERDLVDGAGERGEGATEDGEHRREAGKVIAAGILFAPCDEGGAEFGGARGEQDDGSGKHGGSRGGRDHGEAGSSKSLPSRAVTRRIAAGRWMSSLARSTALSGPRPMTRTARK